MIWATDCWAIGVFLVQACLALPQALATVRGKRWALVELWLDPVLSPCTLPRPWLARALGRKQCLQATLQGKYFQSWMFLLALDSLSKPMKGFWFPGCIRHLWDGSSLPAWTRCLLRCLGKSAWGSRMHHGFRLPSWHCLVTGVMGNSLSYPGTDSGTPSCYHALRWPIRKWHKYPCYSLFYFSPLWSIFFVLFLQAVGDQSQCPGSPHPAGQGLPLSLWESGKGYACLPVFFVAAPVILAGSGNKPIGKVAGRQTFIKLPVQNVHSKMGTVCQPGQALWEYEFTRVWLLWSRVTPACWILAADPFPLRNLHLPGVIFTATFLI